MQSLRTAVLHHVTLQGSHYDWLLENPWLSTLEDPFKKTHQLPLWTARIERPPAHWTDAGRMKLTPIAPHRRRYLDYQGTIAGSRGSVRRVAQGTFTAHLWTPRRCLLEIKWQEPDVACMAHLYLHPFAEETDTPSTSWFSISPCQNGSL